MSVALSVKYPTFSRLASGKIIYKSPLKVNSERQFLLYKLLREIGLI